MVRSSKRGLFLAVFAACAVFLGIGPGCARDPLPCIASLGVGNLVVTEVRGKQSGGDPAQWIEVCNASNRRLGLAGTVLVFLRLDGSGERQVLVRDRGLAVEPGRCAVLGLFAEGEVVADGADDRDVLDAASARALPPYADYDFSDQWDLKSGLYDSAILEVRACGEVVDRLVWRDLPDRGSWSLDGRLAPDAVANDDEARWCVDAGEPDEGYPGTPGERNRDCGT